MLLRLSLTLILLAACGVAAGCDDRKWPTEPGGVTSPTPSPVPQPPPAGMIDTRALEIVSGATLNPVTGATITIGGANYVSDAAGHPVDGEQYRSRDSDVDVVATGYLRRETKASYGNKIVLWPVADEQEMEAIRRMVYARDGSVAGSRYGFMGYPLTVSAEGLAPDGLKVWTEVAAEVARTLQISVDFYPFFAYDVNEVNMRPLGDPPQCLVTPWGFCSDPPPGYGSYYGFYRMPLDRTTDRAAAKRLIFSFFLGVNPLQGFMSVEHPADTLSPLELQTIRMMLLRPRTNRWPDSDR